MWNEVLTKIGIRGRCFTCNKRFEKYEIPKWYKNAEGGYKRVCPGCYKGIRHTYGGVAGQRDNNAIDKRIGKKPTTRSSKSKKNKPTPVWSWK